MSESINPVWRHGGNRSTAKAHLLLGNSDVTVCGALPWSKWADSPAPDDWPKCKECQRVLEETRKDSAK